MSRDKTQQIEGDVGRKLAIERKTQIKTFSKRLGAGRAVKR